LTDILGLSDFGRDYAVIVGLSDFQYFNPLDATKGDPESVFKFLRDEAGFDYILMLRDEEVTYQILRDLFEYELPHTLHSNDRFLFFWSGHGTQFPDALGVEQGYLPLISSPVNNLATMVDMGALTRWDRLLPAKQALFLLDACFSGLAGTTAQGDEDQKLEIRELAKPGHHIISAGGKDQKTIASAQDWQGSIFTYALLKALRGEADRYGGKNGGGDGVINLYELVADMGETVKLAKAAAGWNRPLRPILHFFPGRGEGQFFFLTDAKKRSYLEAQGEQVGDQMAYGMPTAMGPAEEAAAQTGDSYGGRDVAVFSVIRDSTIAKDFEGFLGQFPESALAPYARNRLALLKQRETAPPPTVTARMDPATEEMALNLRPEDRLVVQEALAALGFDPRGTDGVFGANTRRAIIDWQREKGEELTGYLTSSQYGKLLAEAEPKLAALESARQKPNQPSPVQPATAPHQYQPGDEFRDRLKDGSDCPYCPDMVVVPAGSFMMGSSDPEREWAVKQGAKQVLVDREKPQHPVEIAQSFAVGKYEITRGQFAAFVEATGHDTGKGCWEWAGGLKVGGWKENASSSWRSPGFAQTDRDPVVCGSWEDAKAYIAWLSDRTGHQYRLLSEAEWEFAARANTTTMRPWGDDRDNKAGCAYANGADLTAKGKFGDWRTMYCRDGQVYTAPVGSYSANGFGLRDMIGNAWEWVEDCYHDEGYAGEGRPNDGGAWTSSGCSYRMSRGGSWDVEPGGLRSASRYGVGPDRQFDDIGFRVAKTLTPEIFTSLFLGVSKGAKPLWWSSGGSCN
jgi:formylglycine-generating enzyme required for sulfatase activity